MTMLAKHIMREKSAVSSATTVKDVVHRLISSGQPGLPVVNDTREVIGVITEFNILGAIREGMDLEKITAERIMSKNPTTADIHTPMSDLIQMMLLDNFTIIPIENNKQYVGVVSRYSIMDAYVSPHFMNFAAGDRKGPFTCD